SGGDAKLAPGGPPPEVAGVVDRTRRLYPARRNAKYVLDRELTDERVAATYNNYYEFTEQKDGVWQLTGKFRSLPWPMEVAGLVEKPFTIDVQDLIEKMPLEERLYRHRCVEAWAMAVPWTGFPMRAFLELAKPLSAARYVRTVSWMRPDQGPGQARTPWY